MIDFFRYLFRPSFWISNNHTCIVWDAELCELMDDDADVSTINKFTVKIGNYQVWVGNYPYAFGSNHDNPYHSLPKRRTRERLLKYIQAQRYKKTENKNGS